MSHSAIPIEMRPRDFTARLRGAGYDLARVAPAPCFEAPVTSYPGSAFSNPDDLPTLRNPAGPPPADVAELALPRPSVGGIHPTLRAH